MLGEEFYDNINVENVEKPKNGIGYSKNPYGNKEREDFLFRFKSKRGKIFHFTVGVFKLNNSIYVEALGYNCKKTTKEIDRAALQVLEQFESKIIEKYQMRSLLSEIKIIKGGYYKKVLDKHLIEKR